MEQSLEKIYNLLVKIFAIISEKTKKVVPKMPAKHMNRNKAALQGASKEIGVKEVRGSGNNRQVVKYHAYAREDNDISKGLADSVPWCASFVCFVLEANPFIRMGSTNSMSARSFLKWGESSKRSPLPGDIVVYWRGKKSGWQGHVGFYLGQTENFIYTLGGNQSDAVNVSKYSKSKLLDIRRSSKAKKYTHEEKMELIQMGQDLIKGNKLNTSDKVH